MFCLRNLLVLFFSLLLCLFLVGTFWAELFSRDILFVKSDQWVYASTLLFGSKPKQHAKHAEYRTLGPVWALGHAHGALLAEPS